jgi:5-bromo-4-chloroindolyl phosphate hydrolysis protein
MTTYIFWITTLITNIVIGVILHRQIKSQKELLSGYKDFISAIDPDKIIKLHDRHIEQINSVNYNDISVLKKQLQETAHYCKHVLKIMSQNPEFNREAFINRILPNCKDMLQEN